MSNSGSRKLTEYIHNYDSTGGDYDDTLNFARYTTTSRLFLAVLFSFLTVVGSGSAAYGDLLPAPRSAGEAFEEGLSVRRGVDIGIHRPPRHHIFPQEHRAFFADRGFTDIDNYTIPLDRATHDAIHKWMGSGPWNEVMKSRILAEEARLGRLLNKREILEIGAKMRREAGLSHVKIIPFQD